MGNRLEPGLTGSFELVVTDACLASNIGSGLVSVFSTAMLIAGMEAAAVESVQKMLADGQTTVGVKVDISHDAATPPGMKVSCRSRLVEIDGRRLTFEVSAYDEVGRIGGGKHHRMIVDKKRFEARAVARAEQDKSAENQSSGVRAQEG